MALLKNKFLKKKKTRTQCERGVCRFRSTRGVHGGWCKHGDIQLGSVSGAHMRGFHRRVVVRALMVLIQQFYI